MVRNREAAATLAENTHHNQVGTCQLWTRTIFDAPSAGDRDRDGDADAVDGWKSEPVSARHTTRKAERGTPGAFSGGSRGFGHRVVMLGGDVCRSTDMSEDGRYSPGDVGTVTIAQIERAMGVTWLGWSETITGVVIPHPEPEVDPKRSRGERVDDAIALLREAKLDAAQGSDRRRQLRLALSAARDIPFVG